VAPSFLLACALWADVRDGWAQRVLERQHSHPALQDAIDDVFNARIGDVSGRGKLAGDMREIWMLQPRFDKRVGSAPFGLVDQPRFRAAFDFMRLRADAGEIDEVLADWWQEFSMADDNLRQDMVDQVREEQTQRPRVARVPRAPTVRAAVREPDATPDAHQRSRAPELGFDAMPGEPTGATDAPKKRRRRRRSSGPREGGEPTPNAGV
jgi:poly(A) polymerase